MGREGQLVLKRPEAKDFSYRIGYALAMYMLGIHAINLQVGLAPLLRLHGIERLFQYSTNVTTSQNAPVISM